MSESRLEVHETHYAESVLVKLSGNSGVSINSDLSGKGKFTVEQLAENS